MTLYTSPWGCHIKGKEKSYQFKDVETLVADFLEEIEKARKG